MASTKKITRSDILPFDQYAAVRRERKTEMTKVKKYRRMAVGPDATFYFESYKTMWHQVHEMLHIERGGEDQISGELAAYNPLIPQGRELVATVMFEIGDPVRRSNVLGALGGVEETMYVTFGGEQINGVAEADLDRTTVQGKASSVQFVHFPFTNLQVEAFHDKTMRVTVGFDHPNYNHSAGM
ncbi:MAG: DUF3501 family protein, partial [Pseudomonadota bacterium]|nr:DUF3501 family protein [Pseudomonadota bacterium]